MCQQRCPCWTLTSPRCVSQKTPRIRIFQYGYESCCRHYLLKQPQLLGVERTNKYVKSGDVPFGAAETGYKADLHRIITATLRFTKSLASSDKRSYWLLAHRYSIATFCPSM